MSSSTLLSRPASIPDPDDVPFEEIAPKVELIESDGEPMESDWHVRQMVTLVDSIDLHLLHREDFYVAGNMFVYFSEEQARNRDFRGPDFFFVSDTTRHPMRRYWCVWKEDGRTPDVVIELSSPTTIDVDHGIKKEIYERKLKVSEYFCYDPDSRLLEGWTLVNKRYQPMRLDKKGRLWSRNLEVYLGPWEGEISRYPDTWLRFFTRDGKLVLSRNEAADIRIEAARQIEERAQRIEESARLTIETARQIEETARQTIETARQREEATRQREEAERSRADKAEAELAALRARLAHDENGHANGGNGKRKKKS